MKNHQNFIIAILLAAGWCLAGCGGGGSSSVDGGNNVPNNVPMKTLAWAPPTAYADSTPLDPLSDLDIFEVYVNQDGNFTGSENAMAAIQSVDLNTGLLNTSFNLSNLRSFLPGNTVLYVSMRAVAKNGLKSDYSQPVAFSF